MAERITEKVDHPINIVDTLLHEALARHASDIYIEPYGDVVRVRHRIDGMVHDTSVFPKTVLADVVEHVKTISNMNAQEHHRHQEGTFQLESDEYSVAFSVSVFPVFDGEKIALRVHNESGRELALDSLGLSRQQLELVHTAIAQTSGMVLVVGPTGSGKTTTLQALMKEMSAQHRSIRTVEDFIPDAARAVLRQDPDAVMMGEIRNIDTASFAMNAALAGHLVLSSIHANSASGALVRLMHMGVPASAINLILAQRLVRRLCNTCKVPTLLDAATKGRLAGIADMDHVETVYTAAGCQYCIDGYSGRVGLFELLEITPDIETIAQEGQYMGRLVADGVGKAMEGITSSEEVIRIAYE